MSGSVVGGDAAFVIAGFSGNGSRFCVISLIAVVVPVSTTGGSDCCKFWHAARSSGSNVMAMFLISVRKSSAREVGKCNSQMESAAMKC